MNKALKQQVHFRVGTILKPQGGDSYLIQPGKPTQWLTPAQFAAQAGFSRRTVYRRVEDGSIPIECIACIGPRRMMIRADAVDSFINFWTTKRFS